MIKLKIRDRIQKLFFAYANYNEPIHYEKQYQFLQCQRENDEIAKIIRTYIPEDAAIVDVGCGTGLGYQLTGDREYVGIDRSKESIDFCIEKYGGSFYSIDADTYLHLSGKLNPLFLFSINYMDLDVIEQYLKETDRVFLAIRYNKPYLGKTSVYSKRRWIFEILHPKSRQAKLDALFEKYNAINFQLLGEPYYTVTIVKKS